MGVTTFHHYEIPRCWRPRMIWRPYPTLMSPLVRDVVVFRRLIQAYMYPFSLTHDS